MLQPVYFFDGAAGFGFYFLAAAKVVTQGGADVAEPEVLVKVVHIAPNVGGPQVTHAFKQVVAIHRQVQFLLQKTFFERYIYPVHRCHKVQTIGRRATVHHAYFHAKIFG